MKQVSRSLLQFLSILSLLLSVGVKAQTGTIETPDIATHTGPSAILEIPRITGEVTRSTTAWSKLKADFCEDGEKSKSKILNQGSRVSVVARFSCKPQYSGTKEFYRVMIDGSFFFVNLNHIRLKDSDEIFLVSMTEEMRQAIANQIENTSAIARTKISNELLAAIEATRMHGMTLIESSVADVSRHTEGTSFKVSIFNPTKKTIKYVTFNVEGINSVGDPVSDVFNGGPMQTVRAVGPIEANQLAEYKWEYMWHTDLVTKHRITEVKIQFTDNVVKIIRKTDAITLTESHRQFWKDEWSFFTHEKPEWQRQLESR